MAQPVDPAQFGLPPRTVMELVGKKHYALVISRKSRVIMADGEKILEKAEKIRHVQPGAKVSLKISAPLCSKTRTYLEEHGIQVVDQL
jgi:hypothetical protein